MGQVDLNFKPSVPVFDANVALGRRHDLRVRVDTAEGTLRAMRAAGVGRALVYSQHATEFDGRDGNQLLLEMIQGEPGLIPQFVCNPGFEDMAAFADGVMEHRVRSVRMVPALDNYPFRDWVVGPWLAWLAEDRIPLWLNVWQVDPSELHDTASAHPDVAVVLSEVHYSQINWAVPLLRSLPNLYIEISRYVVSDGIQTLLDVVGEERILFGSRFPASPMAAQLYNLHRCGLSRATLEAICSRNLERLLEME